MYSYFLHYQCSLMKNLINVLYLEICFPKLLVLITIKFYDENENCYENPLLNVRYGHQCVFIRFDENNFLHIVHLADEEI